MDAAVSLPNPYVGPRVIQSGEPLFGRDAELRHLRDQLIADRLVLLMAPSGAGKSSLLNALVSFLRDEDFFVYPVMRLSQVPPQGAISEGVVFNRYTASLLLSLEQGLPGQEQLPLAQLCNMSLEAYLQRREEAHRRPDVGSPSPVVLIFDQFEEIFTLNPLDLPEKDAFFTQVGEALHARHRFALFSLREEYLAAVEPYRRLFPGQLRSTFRLGLLSPQGALEAVRQPPRRVGVEFAEPAAARLVDDLRRVSVQQPDGRLEYQLGLFIEPVQLQVVCNRLWQGLDPGQTVIDEQDLAGIGSADQALEGFYASQVAQAAQETGVSERKIRDWFDRQLITPTGFRSQVMMDAESSAGLENQVIQRLEDAYLVRGEKRGGITWFELAHDRLVAPVRSDNEAWFQTHLSFLQRQAALWQQQDRPSTLLLQSQALAEAEAWAREHPQELDPLDDEFLVASRLLLEGKNHKRAAALDEGRETVLFEATIARQRRWLLLLGVLLFLSLVANVFLYLVGD